MFAHSYQKNYSLFRFHSLPRSFASSCLLSFSKKKSFFTFSLSFYFLWIRNICKSLFFVLAAAFPISERYTTMMRKSQKNSMESFQDLFIIFQLFISRWHALHIFSFRKIFSSSINWYSRLKKTHTRKKRRKFLLGNKRKNFFNIKKFTVSEGKKFFHRHHRRDFPNKNENDSHRRTMWTMKRATWKISNQITNYGQHDPPSPHSGKIVIVTKLSPSS